MDEQLLRSDLDHFLKRYLRNRLINRLIAWFLFNLAAYLLLLTVVILSDSSLFVFHLLLFCTLSLLPFFLLLGTEGSTLARVVRCLDEHCLIESYLHTPSVEHRSFMRQRVQAYLERRKSENPFPFRLFRGNLYLIGICLLLFVLLQATSFFILQDFTVSLSAREIKNRLTERSALEGAVAELPVEDSEEAAATSPEKLQPTSGGETGQRQIGKTAWFAVFKTVETRRSIRRDTDLCQGINGFPTGEFQPDLPGQILIHTCFTESIDIGNQECCPGRITVIKIITVHWFQLTAGFITA